MSRIVAIGLTALLLAACSPAEQAEVPAAAAPAAEAVPADIPAAVAPTPGDALEALEQRGLA